MVQLGAGAGSANRSMTNLSIVFLASSGISFGPSASINSVSVSSGSDFHVDHAVSFPCPAKLDIMSQPVKAWNIGREHDISRSYLVGCQVAKALASSSG